MKKQTKHDTQYYKRLQEEKLEHIDLLEKSLIQMEGAKRQEEIRYNKSIIFLKSSIVTEQNMLELITDQIPNFWEL